MLRINAITSEQQIDHARSHIRRQAALEGTSGQGQMETLRRHPLFPDDRMADSGWKTPDIVDIMLKMCSWLPLIHIMKHSSPTLLKAPVAFSTSAYKAKV
jgi:hypothetical protein